MFVAISASLGRVIQHDGCGLVLYDPDTGRFRCHVLKSTGEQFTEEGAWTTITPCPADSALTTDRARRVRRAGAAVARRRLRMHRGTLLEKGVKSFCCVPLLSHDRVLGVAERRAGSATRRSRRTTSSC